MGWIDFTLNLAALLLWLSWRAARFDPLGKTAAVSLLGTLKRAEQRRPAAGRYLLALGALLLARAVLYWQIGPAVHWTPHLRLVAVSIPFRSEFFDRMLVFSLLSFGVVLAGFLFSLVLLSVLNPRVTDDEISRLVRIHLGRVDRWPVWVKGLLPFVAGALFWVVTALLLSAMGIIPRAPSSATRFHQALLIGLCAYLTWKYVLVALLLLHLLNSYVYLGNRPLWNFVNGAARKLLAPLRPLPLRWGMMDFSPVVGMALVFVAAELAGRWLPRFFPR